MGSALNSFSKRLTSPKPGGVKHIPLGFLTRNCFFAISSMVGIVVVFLAEMKTIISFSPFKYSGRYTSFGYGGMYLGFPL